MMMQHLSSPSLELIESALDELYERRLALDQLIESLQEYGRTFVENPAGGYRNPSQNGARLRRLAS